MNTGNSCINELWLCHYEVEFFENVLFCLGLEVFCQDCPGFYLKVVQTQNHCRIVMFASCSCHISF